MTTTRQRRYGVFNVVAQPHPDGIYRDIFERAVGQGVKYWGEYFAAITPLSGTRDNIFTGRLLIWMAVDPESNVVNLRDFSEVPLSNSSDVLVPDTHGINSRTFEFAFNVKSHRLYLELNNEDRKTVSPRRAEAALQSALGLAAEDFVDEFRVQVVPASDSVARILAIPRLSRLEIHIRRPNPDGLSAEANSLLEEELDDQNAKEVVRIIKKAPNVQSLVANARTKLMAVAASLDGLVFGKGKDDEGQKVEASTKDYPEIIVKTGDVDTDTGGVRGVAGE